MQRSGNITELGFHVSRKLLLREKPPWGRGSESFNRSFLYVQTLLGMNSDTSQEIQASHSLQQLHPKVSCDLLFVQREETFPRSWRPCIHSISTFYTTYNAMFNWIVIHRSLDIVKILVLKYYYIWLLHWPGQLYRSQTLNTPQGRIILVWIERSILKVVLLWNRILWSQRVSAKTDWLLKNMRKS
jgi:hypothetical protein